MKSRFLAVAIALLPMSLVAATADLRLTITKAPALLRSGGYGRIEWRIDNDGPNDATGVSVIGTVNGVPLSNDCCGRPFLRLSIAAGGSYSLYTDFNVPADGPLVVVLTAVSRNVPDENPRNNTVATIVPVSSAPDVFVRFHLFIDGYGSSESPLKPGLPFVVQLDVGNESLRPAHDVVIDIDLQGAGVKELPSNCAATGSGVRCTYAEVGPKAPLQTLVLTLTAPAAAPSNETLFFNAGLSAREENFTPNFNHDSAVAYMYKNVMVTSTANDGAGSLRQAILDAKGHCGRCAFVFRIDEPSPTPWKTIHVISPLPQIVSAVLLMDGQTQSDLLGDRNAAGPEIEITGDGMTNGDGLSIVSDVAEVANLTVNGFRGNGITARGQARLHDLFVGTDPTGSFAVPNGLRGVAINFPTSSFTISNSVLSGNTRSGIFATAGRVIVKDNRIGVKAHNDDPLPNGASGIYFGPLADGSSASNNVVAHHPDFGIAIDRALTAILLTGNLTWANENGNIDIGLDGIDTKAIVGGSGPMSPPLITSARYDASTNTTIIEGQVIIPTVPDLVHNVYGDIELFASDTAGPRGRGDAQRRLGDVPYNIAPTPGSTLADHFRFEAPGDHRGEWITATLSRGAQSFSDLSDPLTLRSYPPRTTELSRPAQVAP